MVGIRGHLLLPIIVVLTFGVPFVIGLNGGDDYLYYFEHCKKLEVNITGDLQIDEGEYIVNAACDLDGEDYWICNCTDDWYFNMTPLPNTINNYSIFFLYDYEIEEKKKSGGGGSSRRRRDTDTYPTYNETNTTEQSTNNTISQPPIEDSPVKDESRNNQVVDKLPQDTKKQNEPTEVRDIQRDVEDDNTKQKNTSTQQKQSSLPWWIVPTGLILIILGITALLLYYAFNEPPSTEGIGREEKQIEDIVKNLEDKKR